MAGGDKKMPQRNSRSIRNTQLHTCFTMASLTPELVVHWPTTLRGKYGDDYVV
jgi:hypothetical protein